MPATSVRPLNQGASHRPLTMKEWVASKSDGPLSRIRSCGDIWLVWPPGPSLESSSMLLLQRYFAAMEKLLAKGRRISTLSALKLELTSGVGKNDCPILGFGVSTKLWLRMRINLCPALP